MQKAFTLNFYLNKKNDSIFQVQLKYFGQVHETLMIRKAVLESF